MQRIGRACIVAGIIFVIWPDIMSQANVQLYQATMDRYWPVGLIVIGFLCMGKQQNKKSR